MGSLTLAARGSVAKTPYFPKTIDCLAVIMGETCLSGFNPGLDGQAILGVLPNVSREIKRPAPISGFRAENGDSGAAQASCPNRRLNLRIGCCFSKLDRAFHAAKLQHHPYHQGSFLLPEPKSRVIKPESHPTLKRRHRASRTSRETVTNRSRIGEPSPQNLRSTNEQSSLLDDRDAFEILSPDKHAES